MEEYKWIQFQESPTPRSNITKVWEVAARDKGPTFLGVVKWFERWRKYAFFPKSDTVYEQDCLRDLAQFCESRTREHKAKTRAK